MNDENANCRYYLSGLLSMRTIDENIDERSFLLIKEKELAAAVLGKPDQNFNN